MLYCSRRRAPATPSTARTRTHSSSRFLDFFKIFSATKAPGARIGGRHGFVFEVMFLAVTQQLPNMRHTFLMKRPGGSVLCRFDLSGARDKIAVISARHATHELMNRLIARHGPAPEAWVPHFERLAPGIVDQPTADGGKEEAA